MTFAQWAPHAAPTMEDVIRVLAIIGGGAVGAFATGLLTQVIVRGYQAKDKRCTPACKANGRDVTFLDGRHVFMGSSGTGAPRDSLDPNER